MKEIIRFTLNDKSVDITEEKDHTLLWVLRIRFGLTGTKYGCGEPAITTMGAVIANAVYDAVGVRMFQLPMAPDRLKESLEKGVKKT